MWRLAPRQPDVELRPLGGREPAAGRDPFEGLLERPLRVRHLVLGEELLDFLADGGIAERREAADDDGVADELAGLLLQLRPALADQLPGEGARVGRAEEPRDEQLRVLRSHIRAEDQIDRLADERGIA